MGQFSWLDCRTEEQVLDNVERNVYVLVPQEFGGGHIKEECYDGYGRFGGHDIYDLVVDWNLNYLEQVYANEDTWKCDWIKKPLTHEDFERVKAGESPCRKRGFWGLHWLAMTRIMRGYIIRSRSRMIQVRCMSGVFRQ